ncbi:mannose-1-phosphate guanyltransferase [Thiosulfatimonas sediminis]|uniref:Mannose-1-phosphate guanyltransferase n=1 Tax=Thiosulfatimonas sediminis TaxID=2675054 RepID=A0A6F8PVI6_9GAMM|nr:ABC transporter permease [Thiosulfatimonas sediminis]BBP46018.1 mannose-1-phosphate guanyltransferase [Thiosulfatimonas sediminis]
MWAILLKELIQMRRDRVTFAMILIIPIMQLILFGYAINNDPKHLPTAVQIEDNSPISRTILSALHNSDYFRFITTRPDSTQSDALLRTGEASFILTIPAGFTQQLIRGERPQILLEADATDPVATANAIAKFQQIIDHALMQTFSGPLAYLNTAANAPEVVILAHYNPEGVTAFNIVPGLVGVILTMTMVMITSMAMTREVERGTLENLLAMPVRPYQVMIGKIAPYILVGAVQTVIILITAHYLFAVPFLGSLWLLSAGVVLFILANLALGFTFSTLAQSQMQAMQLTIFFFLPSILLSGFMFPFHGMPDWAQLIGESLPLTHFLRIIRGVMLKDSSLEDLLPEFIAIALFMLLAGLVAIKRYRQTLD